MRRGLITLPCVLLPHIMIVTHRRVVVLRYQRLVVAGLAGVLAVLASPTVSQEVAVAKPAFHMPTAAFALSAECRSKRIAADKPHYPLRSLNRAVWSKPHVKVLAIGSSSTVGLGASSPTATYVARLEPTLEGALRGLDFDVVGRGMSGEEAQGGRRPHAQGSRGRQT